MVHPPILAAVEAKEMFFVRPYCKLDLSQSAPSRKPEQLVYFEAGQFVILHRGRVRQGQIRHSTFVYLCSGKLEQLLIAFKAPNRPREPKAQGLAQAGFSKCDRTVQPASAQSARLCRIFFKYA